MLKTFYRRNLLSQQNNLPLTQVPKIFYNAFWPKSFLPTDIWSSQFHLYAKSMLCQPDILLAKWLLAKCLLAECLLSKCMLSECMLAECLLVKCLSAKCLLAKCPTVKCVSSKCLSVKCLLFKCQSIKWFSTKIRGTMLQTDRHGNLFLTGFVSKIFKTKHWPQI